MAAFSLPTVGVVATLFALFGATTVSPHAFIAGIFINVLSVWIMLRVGSILTDITLFSFLFQVSLVLPKNSHADVDINPDVLVISEHHE